MPGSRNFYCMPFRGWPEEALDFYQGLEADNSKTYWQKNKSVYEDIVRKPMEDLLAELSKEFGEGKIFRPYRDIRFSPDKSPYKTHIGATLAKGGYVQLSSQGLGCGCGMYMMASDQLERYRAAVDDARKGERIEGIVAKLKSSGIEVSAHGSLKTAPKGFPKDHPRIELLRQKGLISWRSWQAGAWLGTAKAKGRVVEFLRSSKPLNDWLSRNVGASSLPAR